MRVALTIREDVSSKDLGRLALHEKQRRAAMRMLAITKALDGMSPALAAQAAGMDYQACSFEKRSPRSFTWMPPSIISAQVMSTLCGVATEPWP